MTVKVTGSPTVMVSEPGLVIATAIVGLLDVMDIVFDDTAVALAVRLLAR